MGTSDNTSARAPFPPNWQIASDFDPNDHLMQLKGRDYLNVQARMLWFIRDQRALIVAGLAQMPYIIRTEVVEQDRERQFAHFKTFVRDVLGNEATMYGSETGKDFVDYAEKASTKSLGRALLALGYGTAFAPEMDEGERVADAPQDRRPTRRPQAPARNATPAAEAQAARRWEQVTALAAELHLSDDDKRALVDQHGKDAEAIYAALCRERDALAQAAAQTAQAQAQPQPPAYDLALDNGVMASPQDLRDLKAAAARVGIDGRVFMVAIPVLCDGRAFNHLTKGDARTLDRLIHEHPEQFAVTAAGTDADMSAAAATPAGKGA